MQRKLLFGLTLMSAIASMYAGLFGRSTLQTVLIVLCAVLAIAALVSPSAREDGGADPEIKR